MAAVEVGAQARGLHRRFYKSLADAFDEPALTLHYRAEGRQSYAVLLFVLLMRLFDLADPGRKGRIKFYVRRVYITDDADLLPPYTASCAA